MGPVDPKGVPAESFLLAGSLFRNNNWIVCRFSNLMCLTQNCSGCAENFASLRAFHKTDDTLPQIRYECDAETKLFDGQTVKDVHCDENGDFSLDNVNCLSA